MVEGPHSEEEIRQAKEYIRTTPLDAQEKANNNRGLMLDKILLTHSSLREYLKKGKNVASSIFLNKYPRLRDMPEAVFLSDLFTFTRTLCLFCVRLTKNSLQ